MIDIVGQYTVDDIVACHIGDGYTVTLYPGQLRIVARRYDDGATLTAALAEASRIVRLSDWVGGHGVEVGNVSIYVYEWDPLFEVTGEEVKD